MAEKPLTVPAGPDTNGEWRATGEVITFDSKLITMVVLKVSAFVGKGALWLYLDSALILQNNQSLEFALEEGQEYIVHWFVKAPPGSSYSITISSPKEAEFQLTKVIGEGSKDQSAFHFKV